MTQSSAKTIAMAFIHGNDEWRWHLRIDNTGLYRWYLEGEIWTGLRGVTRADAENALRRFVEQSFHGEVQILDTR
jgi:hypothetical protein